MIEIYSSHDTDIVAIITAMGIFPDHQDDIMRWDKYNKHGSIFKSTSIVPMGGHIIIERLECEEQEQDTHPASIRIIINGRIQEIPDCIPLHGTDKRYRGVYSLPHFEEIIKRKWNRNTFCEMCGLGPGTNNSACINKISFYEP